MASSYLLLGVRRVLLRPNLNFQSLEESNDIDMNVRAAKVGAHNDLGGVPVEGIKSKANCEPRPSEDLYVFAKTVWGPDTAYGLVSFLDPTLGTGLPKYNPE
jgi:hypothetical protein